MFCARCGSEIAAAGRFCPKCGQAVGPTTAPGGMFTLTIIRAKQFYLVNPAVKVTVDAQAEYTLPKEGTLHIPVSDGAHEVGFSCGIRKTFVNINVTSDVALTMKWNRVTGGIEVD